jgi:hypothetical protein
VPVCYDAHWIGYKLGSGTGATSGQAAAKLYSLTVAGDAVQATAASQPLLLSHNGSDNYWWGSGVTGNYCSTPNAAANQIVGDFDIKVKITTGTLSGTETGLFTKYDGITNKAQYMLVLRGDGFLRTYISSNGTSNSNFVSNTTTIANNWTGWVRVTRVSSTGLITYYTSTDGATWTQLGTTTNLFTGNLYSGDTEVEIGAYNTGASGSNVSVKVLQSTISNSIGGAPVVDFNPASYNAATSQTAWTSATGEVWTINTGTATTGYKGVLVDRTIVQGDGVDDQLKTTSLSITTSTRYASINPFVATAGFMISGLLGGTGDKQLFYFAATTARAYSLVSFINFVGVNSNKLQLFQATFNGASSQVSINNANNTTGILTNDSYDTLVLFSNLSTNYKNMTLTTLVQSNLADDATNRTATYNLIRSLNNNAF